MYDGLYLQFYWPKKKREKSEIRGIAADPIFMTTYIWEKSIKTHVNDRETREQNLP